MDLKKQPTSELKIFNKGHSPVLNLWPPIIKPSFTNEPDLTSLLEN